MDELTWKETLTLPIWDEDGEVSLEIETTKDRVYLTTVKGNDEQAERKYIGSIKTLNFLRIMDRAKELWQKEAEEMEQSNESQPTKKVEP